MSRIYTVPYSGTITSAGGNSDLLYVAPADDKPCRLHGWIIGETSDVADAAEEGVQLSIILLPATVTVGSGGAAVTPVTQDKIDSVAAGFTARCNDTTVATTTGTIEVRWYIPWINRVTPFEMWFPSERYMPIARQGEALVVRMDSTLADDITGLLTFVVEEL